ncbi:MAG: hypothetical protein IKZ39_00760 [Lachnospiraceae bacterium]|nr:hypothetical protein [Lachnospiraceae bacterium]
MKRITSVLLALLMVLGLCACEKPAQDVPSASVKVTESTEEVSDGDEAAADVSTETLFAYLPEDARRIAQFTGVDPGEYEDIRDLDYYVRYIESMYAIPHWKAVGTAELILGIEPSIPQEKVVNYLNGRAPRGFAFLFEGFFLEKYATDEIIEYAKSYAYYLTKASLEKHSFAEFMTEDYREEWFREVGCTREYDYDEYDRMIENGEHKRVDGITTVQVGRHTWQYGAEPWVENASELYEVIYDGMKSFDAMEEAVKADAPAFFDNNSKDKSVFIELVDNDVVSVTSTINYEKNITLGFAWAAPHEYVHTLTKRGNGGGPDIKWIGEGVADYYAAKYKNGEGVINHAFTEYLKGNETEGFWGDMESSEKKRREALYEECKEIFNAYKEKYGAKYSDDLYAFLAVGEKEIEIGEAVICASVFDSYITADRKLKDDFNLEKKVSYLGACVLVRELIKDFGAEKVLSFLYKSTFFEDEFGMTSEEYFEMVRERGGYKLGFFDDTPYNND